MKHIQLLLCLWCSLLLSRGYAVSSDTIRYVNTPIITLLPETIKEYPVVFKDTIGDAVLYQTVSANGIPITYHRNIKTSVCFDGLCRLLDIVLYWTPTGSYHGFELPEGEYLSKTDHDPFTHEEYLRLHEILNDSISPLGDFSFIELVNNEEGTSHEGVDAVSSATLTEVKEHVIAGAAYTTYRLWHIFYGATRDEIRKISLATLNEEMALQILQNGTLSDQVWVLKTLPSISPFSNVLQAKLLTLLNDTNLNLVEHVIEAIDSTMLQNYSYQKQLVDFFQSADHARKILLLQKLKQVHSFEESIANQLVEILPSLQGDLLNQMLQLLREKELYNPTSIHRIALLLESKNKFVSKKVYEFLSNIANIPIEVRKALEAYEVKAKNVE